MDISRNEQRILHLLAQGGRIEIERNDKGRIAGASCFTRDGWLFPELDLELFRKLRRRKSIASEKGGPYRITRRGLALVRARPDNQ
ncbi:MAG: YjhX family toxin [Rhizobiaceae bacterium]|nr:YjhX family toxin [Rhizobiaceae bacterium]